MLYFSSEYINHLYLRHFVHGLGYKYNFNKCMTLGKCHMTSKATVYATEYKLTITYLTYKSLNLHWSPKLQTTNLHTVEI